MNRKSKHTQLVYPPIELVSAEWWPYIYIPAVPRRRWRQRLKGGYKPQLHQHLGARSQEDVHVLPASTSSPLSLKRHTSFHFISTTATTTTTTTNFGLTP